jgi:UDP-N-acetylglucosamine:LPS N-acetylglucosamine transferase
LTGGDNDPGRHVEVVVADVIEHSSVLDWLFVAFYNYLTEYHPTWMKYYIDFIELVQPNNCSLGYWLAYRYVKKLLLTVNPVVVVSVHPMTNHYLARIIKELPLKHAPDLIVIVTDPNGKLWSGWACRGACVTVSPNELATAALVDLGVPRQKILTIGMPVDPEFLHPPKQNRDDFLTSLQLSSNLPTLCLTAGIAGGGNALAIYKALGALQNSIQVIVVCGDNPKLAKAIRAESLKSGLVTAIVDRLPSMSDVMNACDLLVTKAGGLTTYEAVARRLPMAIDMITEPMPQEVGTAALLIDAGLATGIENSEEILALAESLQIRNRSEPPLPLPLQYNLNRTDSVYEIAKLILSNCHFDDHAHSSS